MARTIATGEQSFEEIIANNYFYVDKTNFIKEWWEGGDSVTLIARPRRFGKTLTLNMLERFFSVKYKGQGELFEGLDIWKDEKYRELQGTYPVISLSFAGVKGNTFESARYRIFQILADLYDKHRFLLEGKLLTEREKKYYDRISENMAEDDAVISLNCFCDFMQRYYGRKAIVLLDEYDTPMQEAYVNGYWDKLVCLIRNLFNSTFKTNRCLGRAVMTGITRVSKESIFSDLNNLTVVTTTSNKYEASFGFTQEEVSRALREFGLSEKEDMVRDWYDGFIFGNKTDIYNPWSITNFLDSKKFKIYWVNTSSNSLVNELIRRGGNEIKYTMEDLLKGSTLHTKLDEQIVFNQLNYGYNEEAIWSLLLASGYLRLERYRLNEETGEEEYDLKLTNKEVEIMFRNMIAGWFRNHANTPYNGFIRAMLSNELAEMNRYMNDIALETLSFFDSGRKPCKTTEPERFYHGFVLGLMVDLAERYAITSNRESGYGRYDVMLKPKEWKTGENPAIILEFKVHDPEAETTLRDTVDAALKQIKQKAYAAALLAEGIPKKCIRIYGFAFEGKKVLIDGG
ncbi:MAG: ATP-binding protein [Lachnospiraceae bacterium]|nr:ATP-binding protein [Lachnospiraceae bacterium]